MTTSRSPLRALQKQADEMAEILKKAERREPLPAVLFREMIAAARERPSIIFGVVMDDKSLKIEMTWESIAAHSQASLSAFILKNMRGHRDTGH